ncbi:MULTISPECIES: transglutaminase domain-containing protein, partial [unclassified Endozoicomonas]|uniref:transglutaminase domain-containing protein n=1 Tax=unclassified Endozoicomonas TaxID=2644528 RepID=UPI002149799B
QHLEGELNDILAGDAHPGFHLFATTNPPEYSGRKPLSPALKGRFRHLPVRQYNPAELQSIAEKVLPETPQGKVVAEKLTRLHCQLRACLHQKKLPFQPTSLDLQNVAKAVLSKNDFTEDGLHQCLNQHYRLYLMAADLSLEELPKSPALAIGKGSLDSGLCEWLNRTVSGICRPWLIRQSDRNSIDEKGHEIRIKTQLSTEAAKTEIIRMVAHVKWQATGLSLKPDQSDDILTRALYRYWQQRWFDHEFGLKDVDADSVFPLTEEQKQTLRLPASLPYLHEADQRIEAWNSHKVQPCPALWHQMIDLPNHWAEAPEKYNPKVDKNRAETLDRETNYEGLETSLVYEYKIFDTQDPPPHMYRCQAEDIRVSAKGDITLINISSQYIHGAEILIPDPLPGHNQTVTLTSDQTLAIFNQSSKNGQFALPSLKPDDHIVALRIDPELAFTLVRDRYTGLHTVFIPEANAEQKIQFTYIVEPKQPDGKIRVQEARPERATYLDTHCSKGMKTVIENLLAAIDDLDPPAEQMPLWKIKNARSTTQRIKAITAYCQAFSGKAQPENNENFFQFLVTQRQGSCRHRVPVFIAFCRYYGIQCRQISNSNHSFAEYSLDKGKTWKSVDLGGEPVQLKEIVPDFQLTRKVHGSGTELKKIKNLLKRADSAQCEALAEALGIRLEALNEALETNSALPKINLDTVELVRSLWARRDLAGFSMGVSIIESQEAEALSHYEKELFGGMPYHDLGGMPCYSRQTYKPMSDAVREILYANDEDQVTEPLRLLHSKMIDKAGACRHQWLSSIVDVLLESSDLTKPSFIQFAREALALGWLDPLPIYESQIVNHGEHYELLLRLEAINELKVNAVNCMKKWYKALLSREKNSQVWQHTYISSRVRESNALFVTHCHDGFSTTLENLIAKRSLQIAWTDQPEGVPNIERLLVRHPAFPQLNSGKANYRPVIILGQPRWYDEGMSEKTEALFRLKIENNPNLKLIWTQMNERAEINQQFTKAMQALSKEFKVAPGAQRSKDQEEKYQQKMADINSHYMSRLDSLLDVPFQKETPVDHLKYKCMEAIEHAFIHYLYEVTHSKGARLTYCWAGARIRSEGRPNHFGAHDPSSPEELYAMMSVIQSSSRLQDTVKDAYLSQAHNASNALVLKSDELTKIAEEFLSTVNLNSMSDALDTW